jgi:NAD(P)-dependent dehydrogenase (short-subunit alcohol dehydrogenase family)
LTGRLSNKTLLITGGCTGIGLASMEVFVAEGANALVADVQYEKGAALEARPGMGTACAIHILEKA